MPPSDVSGQASVQVTPRLQDHPSDRSADVASSRAGGNSEPHTEGVPKAGEALVYVGDWVKTDRDTGGRFSYTHTSAG
jgi:hypothetical protein